MDLLAYLYSRENDRLEYVERSDPLCCKWETCRIQLSQLVSLLCEIRCPVPQLSSNLTDTMACHLRQTPNNSHRTDYNNNWYLLNYFIYANPKINMHKPNVNIINGYNLAS